jgi:hypothetical protein
MAFGRRKKGAEIDAATAAEHHRSARRKVIGYLVILVAVFVGVMLVLAYFAPTQTVVR